MKVNGLRFFFLLLVLAMFSPLAMAQPTAQFLSQPAEAGVPLTVHVITGVQACANQVDSSNVTRLGDQVIIDFSVVSATIPGVCIGIPPPLSFHSLIEPLPAGQYELVLNRTLYGTVDDPVIIPFGVSPGGMPDAVPIPAGRWILPGLVLLLLLLGWRRLRAA
jgi:hypothetical protein